MTAVAATRRRPAARAVGIGALLLAVACTSKGTKAAQSTTTSSTTRSTGTTTTTAPPATHSLIACTGSWQNVTPPSDGFLLGVDSPAADDAWAAGHAGDGSMVIDHWDGTVWQVAWNGPAGTLYSIREISPHDVWASGRGRDGATAVHWDGSAWKVVPINVPEVAGQTILIEVAPVASNDIWAAGLFVGRDASFRLHWNGRAWSLDSSGVQDGTALRSMRVSPQGTIWAVGETVSGAVHAPLVEHWTPANGWATVPSSPSAGASTELHGVLPVSDDDVWTTGFNQPLPGRAARASGPPETPLALNIAGSAIHPVTMAVVPTGARPRHAAALGPNDIFAVGDQNSTQALIEHWDGSKWTVMDNPASMRLFGVSSSPSSSEVWAVGYGPSILHFCR